MYKSLLRIIAGVVTGSILLVATLVAVAASSYTETDTQRVERIYKQLVVSTGLSNMIPPISVSPLLIMNAYNTSTKIVVYQGLIDFTKNDDELALIIAHEMAHSTLQHFSFTDVTTDEQSILESNADKMGAYYISRAGYDVCKARHMWERWKDTSGDYLGANHPSMAYRWDQLNVGCTY